MSNFEGNMQELSPNFASNNKQIYSPRNHQKAIGFLIVLGGIEVN